MLLNTAIQQLPVPSEVIEQSQEGDGHYFTILGNAKAIHFEPQALLAPEAQCLKEVTCAIAPNKDITKPIRNNRQTEMRKISVVYPRLNVSTLVPLGDVVLKMRDDIGLAQERRRKDDGRAFFVGYGVSEIEVGIPVDVFTVLWNQLNRQLKNETKEPWQDRAAPEDNEHSAFSVGGFYYQDGYYWGKATLQKALMGAAMSKNGEPVNLDIVALMRRRRQSLKCDAAMAFRLINFKRAQWELRMTLWTVALKDEASQHDIEHTLSRLALNGSSTPETISDWEEIERD